MIKDIAVITGDIVGSSKLSPSRREELTTVLKEGLAELLGEDAYDIYRGDSFQAVLQEPNVALRKAIQIRCYIRYRLADLYVVGTTIPRTPDVDARISIGIGQVSYQGATIKESDGEAFQFSGRIFDNPKHKEERLFLKTPDRKFNEIMEVVCNLLDAMISHWSAQQSEVVYKLLNGEKQTEIANQIGIAQASVSLRIRTAHWQAVEKAITFFENYPFQRDTTTKPKK